MSRVSRVRSHVAVKLMIAEMSLSSLLYPDACHFGAVSVSKNNMAFVRLI